MSTGFKTKGGLEIREGHWCWVSRKFSESCSSIVKSPGLRPQQVAGLFRKEIYSTVTLLQYFLTSSWCFLYTHITWFIFLDEWGSGSSFKKFCWIHFSEVQFVSVYVLHACQMYNLKIFTRNIHPCKQRHHHGIESLHHLWKRSLCPRKCRTPSTLSPDNHGSAFCRDK